MKFKFNIETIFKYQLILLVGILVVAILFALYNLTINLIKYNNLAKLDQYQQLVDKKEKTSKTVNQVYARLDGSLVAENMKNLFPTAVVVDNHIDALPNYGLSQANLIYEALVEGGATRFLALYTPHSDKEIRKIGPVRSARPYFVELAKEYDAMLAHSGGSPTALNLIKQLSVNNLEEIAWWGPDYFWRVYSREAPHNLFTSNQNLAQALIDWELADKKPNYRTWLFEKNTTLSLSNSPIQQIHIKISDDNRYNSTFKYSSSTNSYIRFQNNKKHIDALNNKAIQIKNIIIQKINPPRIKDEIGRLEVDLVGQAEAVIFKNGEKIDAIWRKRNLQSRTVFYDLSGDEVLFEPGLSWLILIPKNKSIEYK